MRPMGYKMHQEHHSWDKERRNKDKEEKSGNMVKEKEKG